MSTVTEPPRQAGQRRAAVRDLMAMLSFLRPAVRGMLPYPDLPRRIRVRRKAFRLVTCTPWPGDDATGDDAAQLALLRLLWLQKRVRRAVRMRRGDEAALLARASLETCIIGLYCARSGDAVTKLTAANNRAAGRAAAYLTDIDLVSKDAINAAAQALGEIGPDLNIGNVAQWLEREQGVTIAGSLYRAYYVPLSHFFVHANAFTLTRHVHPDDTLLRRPAFPWTRRSAVRLADGCAGLMAQTIADKAGNAAEPFTRYARAHLDRTLTPAVVAAARGWRQSVPWHKMPRIAAALIGLRRYTGGAGRADEPAAQEAQVRERFGQIFAQLMPGVSAGMFSQATDELVTKLLDDMNRPAQEPPSGTET